MFDHSNTLRNKINKVTIFRLSTSPGSALSSSAHSLNKGDRHTMHSPAGDKVTLRGSKYTVSRATANPVTAEASSTDTVHLEHHDTSQKARIRQRRAAYKHCSVFVRVTKTATTAAENRLDAALESLERQLENAKNCIPEHTIRTLFGSKGLKKVKERKALGGAFALTLNHEDIHGSAGPVGSEKSGSAMDAPSEGAVHSLPEHSKE